MIRVKNHQRPATIRVEKALNHRRRSYTEVKAKVVTAVSGTYLHVAIAARMIYSHIFLGTCCMLCKHSRRMKIEDNAKVGAVECLNATLTIQQQGSKDDFNQSFWCELEDHPYFRSIHSAKCPLFYSFIYAIILVLNLQCGKELNKFFPPNSSNALCLLF